jgi:hypothetical protein
MTNSTQLSDLEDQYFRFPHLSSISLTQQDIGLKTYPHEQQRLQAITARRSAPSSPVFLNGHSPILTNGVHPYAIVNGNGTTRDD